VRPVMPRFWAAARDVRRLEGALDRISVAKAHPKAKRSS
jgi:hypothetical protein